MAERERRHDEQMKRVKQDEVADKIGSRRRGETDDEFMDRYRMQIRGIPAVGQSRRAAHDRLEGYYWSLKSTHTGGGLTIEVWKDLTAEEYVTITYRAGLVSDISWSKFG